MSTMTNTDYCNCIPKGNRHTYYSCELCLSKRPISSESISKIPGITGKGDMSKKPHHAAMSPFLIDEVAKVFRFGALKHGPNNFRQMTPEASQEVIDATFRHLNAYLRGETHAEDSKLHHLAHVTANISMLYRVIQRYGDKACLEVISGGDIIMTER